MFGISVWDQCLEKLCECWGSNFVGKNVTVGVNILMEKFYNCWGANFDGKVA